MTENSRIRVAPEEEFDPNDRKIVTLEGGTTIGVFNIDGEYHAIMNKCLHQHGPVCEGELAPDIAGEFVGVGERTKEVFTDEVTIRCPWHGWEYYIKTGENVASSDIKLRTFDTVVDDGIVYLEL